MKFSHIVCGGTFDHFHIGHEKLLKSCFKDGEKITIGITSMAMVRPKHYSTSIESYSTRKKNILHFASKNNKIISLVKLNDIYGPTLTNSSIDAIYVTKETLLGAKTINLERIKIGMKPLTIVVVPLVVDDNGDKVSSERIRQGLINRAGMSYYKHLISRETYFMPDKLKGILREPLGRIISSLDSLFSTHDTYQKDDARTVSYTHHISVGDVITYNLKKKGVTPFISVIDGKTQRKALNKEILDLIKEKDCSIAPNKKGTIQKEAVYALYTLFVSGHNRAIKQLFIQGEEDLLTLVVILFSPLHYHVWYGQNEKGAIDVLVTEKIKETVYNLLSQFE